MGEKSIRGPAKCGITRVGTRVYVTLEFPSEYEAMAAYDTFTMGEIEFGFTGPVACGERDAPEITPPETKT